MEREKANKTIEVWQSTCRQGQEKEGGNTPSGQDGAPSPLPQTGNALLVIGKELPGLGLERLVSGCGAESVTWSALKTRGAVRSHHSPPLTCRSHTEMALREGSKKHDHVHEPTHTNTRRRKAYEQSPSKLVYYTDVEKYLVVHYKHALVPLAPFRLTIEGNSDIFLIHLPRCGNMPLSAINIILLMLDKTVPFGKHYAPPVTLLISIIWIIAIITVGGREITIGLNYSTTRNNKGKANAPLVSAANKH